MSNRIFFLSIAALLLGAVNGARAQDDAREQELAVRAKLEAQQRQLLAQQDSALQQLQGQQQAQAQQLQAQQQLRKERVAAEEELREARRQLEQAAREVARLSGELSGTAGNWPQGFRYDTRRSMLGINVEDAEDGVRVAGLSPNGPAEEAGIKVGDTITALDGAALADSPAARRKQSPSQVLIAAMQGVEPGKEITLHVRREDGKEQDVKVRAREVGPRILLAAPRPAPAPGAPGVAVAPGFAWLWHSNPWSDLDLAALSSDLGKYFGTDKGVLVVRAPQDDKLKLRDGDVILDIGGRVPTSPEHAMRILGSFQEGETLRMTIMRNQRRETLEFAIPDSTEH